MSIPDLTVPLRAFDYMMCQKCDSIGGKGTVKSAYNPSGSSGWSQQHEATRSISTPPWMGC